MVSLLGRVSNPELIEIDGIWVVSTSVLRREPVGGTFRYSCENLGMLQDFVCQPALRTLRLNCFASFLGAVHHCYFRLPTPNNSSRNLLA